MVKCNPRNGKSDSSELLIPEKDVFLKKNKCPQASTWQSVCSTAGMWYVIWSHLSSSWQICKLLPLKQILHGTFANKYFQDLGMSTQVPRYPKTWTPRSWGSKWRALWILSTGAQLDSRLDHWMFFYNHPIVALCIWFSLFCGLRPTFTFHGGLQVSIFTFLGGNQLSTSNSGAGRRLCQSAQVTPWIQILENINFCLISMHISNYSFKYWKPRFQ